MRQAPRGVLMLHTWREGPERSQLKGIDHDCNDIPDAAMTLAVAALFAQGPTRIRNVYNWRVKVRFNMASWTWELPIGSPWVASFCEFCCRPLPQPHGLNAGQTIGEAVWG